MDEQERVAKYEKFLAMKEMLKKIPGVIDVGVGLKETKGALTEEVVFTVYVEDKKPLNELIPEHVIPSEINGVKTDVVKIKIKKKIIRPIRGGVKMDSAACSGSGTLGCMATHPTHGAVLLTNHHVLYDQFYDNTPSPVERDVKVGQPGISCSWCCECNVIGHVKDSQRRNNGNVDCGIAKIIKPDISHIDEIDGGIPITGMAPLRADPISGAMVPVLVNDHVKKTGARTDFTEGIVTHVGIPVGVQEEDKSITNFVDQIEFVSASGTNTKVVDHGDSGSILLNASNQVVGLIMSGAVDKAPFDGVANNIYNVISAMNITINVTPSGSGSSALSSEHARIIASVKNNEEENTTYQVYLSKYKKILEETEEGREVLHSIKIHAKEVRELVYHNRQVTVPWQRNQGPAFVASIVKRLKNHDEQILKECNGISIHTLLQSMAEAIGKTGSDQLKEEVHKYGQWLLSIIDSCKDYEDLILQIHKVNNTVTIN